MRKTSTMYNSRLSRVSLTSLQKGILLERENAFLIPPTLEFVLSDTVTDLVCSPAQNKTNVLVLDWTRWSTSRATCCWCNRSPLWRREWHVLHGLAISLTEVIRYFFKMVEHRVEAGNMLSNRWNTILSTSSCECLYIYIYIYISCYLFIILPI